MPLALIFTLFCTHSVIFPLIIAGIRYRQLPGYVKTLCAWLLFSLATEIFVGDILTFVLKLGNQNIIYYNVYTFFEFGFIALFFYQGSKIPFFKKIVLFTTPLFIAFCLWDMIFLEGVHQLNAISLGVESILLMLFILALFFEISNDVKLTFIEESPVFWILIGLLIYFASTFFLYIFVNKMVSTDPRVADQLWSLNTYSLLVRNIIFCVGILKIPAR